MNNQDFTIEVENSCNRSKKLLIRKGSEYATETGDRLEQFHRAGSAQGIPSTQALVGMMMKHVTSVADMSKNPLNHDIKRWNEKLTDLRNYTILMDALVRDLHGLV